MTDDVQSDRHRLRQTFSGKGLVAIAVWGASFVATRVALEALSPGGLIAVRLLAGTALLALLIKARGRRALPARADCPACALLGVILATHLLLQAVGLRYTTAIHTGWIIGFIPVTIALGAHLLRQQRLHAIGWLGVSVGTAGVLLVAVIEPPDFAAAHFGDLLQVISCLTWTAYTLVAVGPMARNGALRVTTFSMGVAALLACPLAAWEGPLTGPLTNQALLSVAFLGLLCSGVAYYLWFAATREHGPTRTGVLLYFEPFVALLTGAALLHEPITANALGGGVCVLLGVWLVARGSSTVLSPPGQE
ncbi:MAG: DMT family transporter [Planctomycetes bacterium]|nr:DMT family transporter [Planctomycetota bacterium]